jgi:hypothetical protein
MKQRFLLLSVTIFLLSCGDGNKPKSLVSSLLESNTKADVIMTERIAYAVDSLGNQGLMDSSSINTKKYDEEGRMIESVVRHFNGTVSGIWRRSYHPNGLLHKTEETRNGKVVDTEEIFLDDNGKYSYGQYLDSNRQLYEYFIATGQNETGQLLGWKSYTKDSIYIREAQDVYENGMPARYIRKDSAGQLILDRVFRRNEKNEIIEVISTRMVEGVPVKNIINYRYDQYDKKGNWTRCFESDENGKLLKIYLWTYVYSSDSNNKRQNE